MKKIIICSIPMKERSQVQLSIYTSNDKSLPVSDKAVRYPINAFLEKTLKQNDDVKVLLIVKKDAYSHYQENVADYVKELLSANEKVDAKIEYKVIETDFSEEQSVHEKLMGEIVDNIDDGSHVLTDITYGPKDLPIVIFTALNFAEKFLQCEIDNIIYGQANYENGKVINTRICDMVPLYYLNSVTNTISGEDSEKARQMLKSLLSL